MTSNWVNWHFKLARSTCTRNIAWWLASGTTNGRWRRLISVSCRWQIYAELILASPKFFFFLKDNGPVRIRHTSHDFGWQSSHSVDLTGWQAKMASIAFWIPWRNAHTPHFNLITCASRARMCCKYPFLTFYLFLHLQSLNWKRSSFQYQT